LVGASATPFFVALLIVVLVVRLLVRSLVALFVFAA
jgi:hypothetical protein